MEEKKICSKCSELKDRSEYYTVLNKKTGHVYEYKYCKRCHYNMTKPTRKVWMKNNPEKGKKLQTKAVQMMRERGTPGIYAIQTSGGLYVGMSSSCEYRINQHRSTGAISVQNAKGVEYISSQILEVVPNREKRKKREKYWINLLRPELNIRFNPDVKEKRNRKKKK